MKIDSKTSFTQKDIDRLVYLYSQALEFYETSNKEKYTMFKERLQKLLVNPNVFSKMKSQELQTRDRSFTDTTGKRQAGLIKIDKNAPKCALGPSKLSKALMLKQSKESAKDKKLDMSLRVLETVEKAEEEKTKIIEHYNTVCIRKSSIVHDDISTQKANLQKRLAQRKSKIGGIDMILSLLNFNLIRNIKFIR